MKTQYKYIEFIKDAKDYDWWRCQNRKKVALGIVSYEERWKEWEFCPYEGRGFTIECLRDIADFLRQLNAEETPQ